MHIPTASTLLAALALARISYANLNAYLDDETALAREYIDDLVAHEHFYDSELEVRELLADVSTRELLGELSDRLEERGMRWTCQNSGCTAQTSTLFKIQLAIAQCKSAVAVNKQHKWKDTQGEWTR
ncbi:hypothetical protein DFP72DRAFT_1048577 [Ephemerocybe angulata]|uniref:Uncharacterized protein n=1 Tax=Ephemerocybe angulata TaxID=980116 RepID=A0A8H6HQ12_9AGAR|nr:hypothetical protein DFP72DRAFT_1048577 [Tulosesus angulatus]